MIWIWVTELGSISVFGTKQHNTTQAQAKLRAELESSLSLKLEAAVTNAANVGQEQVAAR